MAATTPPTQARTGCPDCALPTCDLPAVADFQVQGHAKDSPHCGLHGYIVMSALGGGTTVIHDRHGYDHMVAALRQDGYQVLEVDALLPKEVSHGAN